ncbi:MAG: hypothetical protein AAF934_09105 [Bacteroidota bacterium]
MLDSLLDSIKGPVASAIAEKVGMEVRQAEQVIPLAGESVKEGIMGAITGGNTEDVLGMFSSLTGGNDTGGAMGALAGLAGSGDSSAGSMMKNMVFSDTAKNFIGKLTGQLGLPSGIANSISTMVLPMILNKIKSAVNDATEGGGVNATGLMKVLGGGDTINNALKDKLGGLGSLLG